MNRPFQILIIDDDIANAARDAIATFDWERVQCKAIADLLRENSKEEQKVDVFLSPSAEMREVWSVVSREQHSYTRTELKELLGELDVLILDIGGIKRRYSSEFPVAVKRNFKELGKADSVPNKNLGDDDSSHDGIEFFHIHLDSFKKNTLIAVLTGYDGTPDPVVDAYIHDFTVQDFRKREGEQGPEFLSPDLPYVVKYGKNDTAGESLTDLILGHYDFFESGLSDSTNRFHISFAASHDHPVMIVGESGTGKEHIAKFIHKQWVRRKLRAHPKLKGKVGGYQVVNCGGLSEQLAQSELFGYLKGSFTGAYEHRLGKIFISAGVSPLGRDSGRDSLKGAKGHIDKQTNADINQLIDAFDRLDNAPKDNQLDAFRSFVRPALVALFREEGAVKPAVTRLVAAVSHAEKMLRGAIEGAGENGDFIERLLLKAEGLLDRPKYNTEGVGEWDLEYKPESPIGTLFLDEFADLPLSVQTLLLRFLQDGEVQPMGFAGRILGMKVRIIVATSDSRVAEFAGTPITGDFRTTAELERPLRIDLLHRVRFQEIRTEPVTKDNVERILRGMIEQKTAPKVEWSSDAVNYLVAEITKILAPSPESPAIPIRRASFGHRRELSRIVDLVWEYAKTAGSRGVRDADLLSENNVFEAKAGLIQRLWSPAMIVSAGNYKTPHPSSGFPEENHLVDEKKIQDIRSDFLRALKNLPEPVTLPEKWRYNHDVYNNPSLLKQGKEMNGIVKRLFESHQGGEISVRLALTGPGIVFTGNFKKLKDAETFDSDFTPGKIKLRLKTRAK